MHIRITDWIFEVDLNATFTHTSSNALDHCMCGYCRNYYECVDMAYPELRHFLSKFGVELEGPSELMPFEPTLLLVCYRVYGRVIQWGNARLYAGSVPVTVEAGENDSLLLWVGELSLPWGLDEAVEEVVSPANTPEFLERMQEIWILRHTDDVILS